MACRQVGGEALRCSERELGLIKETGGPGVHLTAASARRSSSRRAQRCSAEAGQGRAAQAGSAHLSQGAPGRARCRRRHSPRSARGRQGRCADTSGGARARSHPPAGRQQRGGRRGGGQGEHAACGLQQKAAEGWLLPGCAWSLPAHLLTHPQPPAGALAPHPEHPSTRLVAPHQLLQARPQLLRHVLVTRRAVSVGKQGRKRGRAEGEGCWERKARAAADAAPTAAPACPGRSHSPAPPRAVDVHGAVPAHHQPRRAAAVHRLQRRFKPGALRAAWLKRVFSGVLEEGDGPVLKSVPASE